MCTSQRVGLILFIIGVIFICSWGGILPITLTGILLFAVGVIMFLLPHEYEDEAIELFEEARKRYNLKKRSSS
jgi:hypothetical protein